MTNRPIPGSERPVMSETDPSDQSPGLYWLEADVLPTMAPIDPFGTVVDNGLVINANAITDSADDDAAVTITAGGTFYNTTIGTVSETGAYGTGIYLDGGSLINDGLITASANGSHGVRLAAGEAFTNDGMIAASYAITGSIDEAITNSASGLIQAYDYGIAIDSGSITNSGTIIAKATASGSAIYDIEGGGVTNLGTGFIVGADGIRFASGAGQVENYGTIEGNSDVGGGVGIKFKAGGNITNAAGGTIEAGRAIVSYGSYGVTIDNAGTIAGTTAIGIYAKYSKGFDLTNQSGGEILGRGLGIEFGSGTLLNEGLIHASQLIGNVSTGLAVYAVDGGYISNASTGSIASRGGIEFGAGGAGTLENAGRVVGDIGVAAGFGVSLAGYGTIVNEAGGYITGYDGILDTSADGVTVVNAGTIYAAAAGYAIKLGSGNDRVELAAGSKINGSVTGGAGTNVLELLAGGNQGTLTGLGTQFRGFGQVTIDTAATWAFAGSNDLLHGSSLSVLGTLANTGYLEDQGTITVYGSLENTGTIEGPGRLSTPITVTGTADLDNAAGATIAVSAANAIAVEMTGGTFTNEGSLYLSGNNAVGVYMTAGTFVNSGEVYLNGAGGIGVKLFGGNLSNTGKILGGSSGIGILMADTQSFYNAGYVFGQSEGVKGYLDESVTNAAGGSISASDYGIEVQSGSVLNEGNVRNDDLSGGAAIEFGTGTLTNTAGGYILSGGDAILFGSGVGTVFNSGTVLGTSTVGGAAIGVKLQYGGYIFNGTDAVVEGTTAIRGYNSGATSIVNAGTLDGTYDFGIYLGANNPLYLDNQTGGTIYGRALGVVFGHGGTIVNAGTIESPGGTFAIRGMYGGAIINQAGGLITGYSPISLGGTVTATVENMGTIKSTGIYAIQFDRGNARLELGEGGTITGKVVGGSGDNVLELVAGAAEGTLANLGVQYLAFETITVDPGADWALSTDDTLAPGYTLSVLGTLNNTGAFLDNGTIVDSGTLENTGSISDHTSFGIAVTVTSTGSLDNAFGAEIYDNGNNGEAIYLDGGIASNEGTLDSAGNDGIGIVIAGGSLSNSGLIEGAPGTGIGVEFTRGGTLTETAGTIGGYFAIQSLGTYAFTLDNAALIGTTNAYLAIDAKNAVGVSILNEATGLIEGTHDAIQVGGGTITNAGSIETGTQFTAIASIDRLGVSNAATGLIVGGTGISIGGVGTVVNAGTIEGTAVIAGAFGVNLHSGGTLVNEAGGTILGYLGVVFGNEPDSTLVNKGSILAGPGEDAVRFYGGPDHLTIYAGAYFRGDVVGYRASSNTIALAGGTAPLPGTFSGFGTEYQGFQSVDVETGADWQFSGANTFASGYALNVYGVLTNVGTLASYASIDVTGTLVNAAGALLESLTLTSTAVSITGAGTLDNLGIIATPTTTGAAVYFNSTGGFENSGTIEGRVDFGPASAVGPITNAGTIEETGLILRAVEFAGGVPIFHNAGYIHASGASGDAVDLAATGGTLVNETGATISIYTGGYNAAISTNYASSITNAAGGFVSATGVGNNEDGIEGGARSHLYVLNQGTIDATGAGLYQAYGGTVSLNNQALIEATGANGDGVDLVGSGTVINTGTIEGTSGSGVGLEVEFSTATVTNAAGGLIEGGRVGVYTADGGAVTLVDAGTITGSYAVLFNSTGSVLELEAGAVIHGKVQGDQGTLELAAGAGTGTLSGLGVSYTGFSLVTIGAGIEWVFGGSNTVATGEDLAIGGTIAVNGTLADAGTISVASGGALDFGSGDDELRLVGNAVLDVQGAVDGGGGTNTLALYGSGGTLSGFATDFTHFQELFVEFGAEWTLGGTNTIASGETLEDAGTLSVSGTFTDDGVIIGAGTVELSSRTDVLAVASDATLFAYVEGYGGTLDLESGSSTGILDGVSRLSGFGELAVASGATWAIYGTIGTGTLLANQGVLLTAGLLTLEDTVNNAGGTLEADGGTIDLFNATITGGTLAANAGGSFTVGGAVSLGTVTNDADISVAAGATLTLAGGDTNAGTLSNAGALVITGPLTNTGLISSSTTNDALAISGAGSVTNAAGGIIAGTYATGGTGIGMGAAGYLQNAGTIDATSFGVGESGAADYVVNRGLIEAAIGVEDLGGGGLSNSGTIDGTGVGGIGLRIDTVGATVTNLAGGLIEGGAYGIVIYQHPGTHTTLVNAGTIEASVGPAVEISGTGVTVEFDAGGVFIGKVVGGGSSTLALVGGANAGTLAALGTNYVGFSAIDVAAGSEWVFTGSNSVASGDTLGIAGTLTVSGTLEDAGAISVASGGALLFGSGNDVLDLTGNAVLSAQGAVDGGGGTNTLELSGAGGTLSGFASNFKHFQVLSVDTGASWTLGGTNKITAGETLVDDGTLGVSGTFTDDGAITIGAGGVLQLSAATDVFDLAAGATLSGSVAGAGGTLELDTGSGTGVITNLTTLTDFGQLSVVAGATWALDGAIDAGTLVANQGVLLTTGLLSLYGNVGNAGGTLEAAGGTIDFYGATIIGGTLTANAGGSFVVSRAGGATTLGTVDIAADLSVASAATLTLTGIDTNTGTLNVTGTLTVTGTLVNEAGGLIADHGDYRPLLSIGTGASLANAGTISAIYLHSTAVEVYGGGLTNTGTIGALGSISTGVEFVGPAAFTNAGLIFASGSSDIAVDLAPNAGGASGTFANDGTVDATGTSGIAVELTHYGTLVNDAGATISAVTPSGDGFAVDLLDGGSVTNAAGGLITASGSLDIGIYSNNTGPIYVLNDGTIYGEDRGINIDGTGTIINHGLIEASAASGFGVVITGGTIENSGTIVSTYGSGIDVRYEKLVTNTAGGLIKGGKYGISLFSAGQADTLVNAGTIDGQNGTAVVMGGPLDLLQVEAGAVFNGRVNGGYGTLELSAGAGTGTLNALGSNYFNFDTIEVDAGTDWVFSGSNTVGIYSTLIDSGTVTVNGTLTDSDVITVALGGVLQFGSGNDVFDLTGGAVLNAAGNVDGGGGTNTLELSGSNGTLSGFASNFTNFQVLSVDAGASWTLGGTNTVSEGETLVDNGVLTVSGTFTDDGTITIGAAGELKLSAKTNVFDLASGAKLTGSVAGAGGTLDLGAGSGAIANLSTFTGFGELAVTDGATWTVAGTIGAGTLVANQGVLLTAGALTIDGTINNTGGTLDAAGGTIDLLGVDLTGGTLISSGGGSFAVGGGLSSTLGTVAIAGDLSVAAGSTLTLAGSDSNTGTLTGAGVLDITGIFDNRGVIDGTATVTGSLTNQGVIQNVAGTGTLVNAGTVTGTAEGNLVVFDAGAVFGGVVSSSTLELAAGTGAGTLAGIGTNFTSHFVQVDAATQWVFNGYNGFGPTIGWTLDDLGTLTLNGTLVNHDGVTVAAGAELINQGTLSLPAGTLAIYGTVENSGGTITSAGQDYIDLTAGAELVGGTISDTDGTNATNAGTLAITGSATLDGVTLIGSQVTIAAGATLTEIGNNIFDRLNLTNLGVVAGNVTLSSGSDFYNLAGSTVRGTVFSNGIVTDDGTIGVGGVALVLGGATAELNLGSGAVFNGTVEGGGGTLSLAAGGGTLTGIGTNFSDFAQIDVNGPWEFQGANTIGVGDTLDIAGTLTIDGTLTDAGAITIAAGDALAFGAGNDVFDLTGNAVLNAGGAVDGGGGTNTLELSGTGGTLSGFGTNFTDFQVVSLDAGAAWSLTGSNTLTAAETLLDQGALTLAGTLAVYGGATVAAGGALTVNGALIDAGTISIAAGGALDFGAGNDVFDLTGGAVLNAGGAVDGGGGTNTLELSGTGGTLSGFGTNFVDFQVLSVATGASWSLAGNNTITASEQLVASGGLAINGDLVDDGGITLESGGKLTVNGTLTDSGTISIASGGALDFGAGNDVFDLTGNAVLNAGGAVDGGGGTNTLELSGTGGTLSGFGTNFTHFQVLSVDAAASWTLGGTNTVISGETLVDDGTLGVSGTFTDDGAITIGAGGVLQLSAATDVFDLAAGAVLTGSVAGAGGTLDLGTGSGTGEIVSLATFTGFGEVAVASGATWAVAGTIGAGTLLADQGVLLTTGALTLEDSITNTGGTLDAAGGVIDLAGVDLTGGTLNSSAGGSFSVGGGVASTLTNVALDGNLSIVAGSTLVLAGADTNAGAVSGTVDVTGTLTNEAGGVIHGVTGNGTLVNAGTVSGKAQASVVVFDAGAIFGGVVSGTTLDLAAGTGTGTLNGLGTNFTGFTQIDVNAAWVFTGANTIGAGDTLDVASNLTIDGTLTDAGAITVAAGDVLDFGAGNDVFDLTGGAVLNASGVVDGGAGTNTLELSGTGGTLSGFGTNFTDFQVLSVDAGAAWSLAGNNTLTASESLLDQGSLGLNGTLAVYGAATVAAGGTLSVSGALIDAGTISIAAGAALDFGAGNDVFDLTGNAVLNAGGAVDGGGGTNTLELSGIGGTLSGFGTNFVDFQVLSVAAGAAWSLAGNNTLSASEQLIASGGLTINGALVDDGGITLESGGTLTINGTLTDSGTISIASGGALDFGAGNDVFDLTGGAVLDASGAVDGGGGTNTLELSGTGGTLSGFGTNFTDFQLISLDAGASWTLAGSNTLTATEALAAFGTLLLTGTLENAGSIIDHTVLGITIAATGSLDNAAGGQIYSDVSLGAAAYVEGASVTNAGTIESLGATGIGIVIVGGTLQNSGVIEGSATKDGIGVEFIHGGSLTQTGGTISGFFGIESQGTYGFTVDNAGQIGGATGHSGIDAAGGLETAITNEATGTIESGYGGVRVGAGSLLNAGLIETGLHYSAIEAYDIFAIDNVASGAILGGTGIEIGLGTIINAGRIDGTYAAAGRYGVFVVAGGTVENTGTISGYTGIGFGPTGGGTLINQGSILGHAGGDAVVFKSGSDHLTIQAGAYFRGDVIGYAGSSNTISLEGGNATTQGTFSGLGSQYQFFQTIALAAGADWIFAGANTLGAGYRLEVAGTLTNTGTLATDGAIDVTGTLVNDGKLTDAGTISIASGGALLFGAGNDVFDLTGNAVLNAGGAVDGGGGTNTLELSGTGGTLSGFGTNFTHFQVLSVDAGASWTLGGTNTVISGETLVDDGTLGVSGTFTDDGAITIGAGGVLQLSAATDVFDLAAGAILTGSVAGAGGTLDLGTGSGTGEIVSLATFTGFGEVAVASGATWAVAGTIGAGTLLADQGVLLTTGALTLEDSITNTGGTLDAAGGVIDLAGVDLTGGTLASSAGGSFSVGGGVASTLTNVALDGNLSIVAGSTLVLAGADTNAGTVSGTVDVTGTLTNEAGGVIHGVTGTGTLVNAGTVSGKAQASVVVFDAGAVFGGVVSGTTLDLAAGTGTGTLNALGTSFTGFSDISVAAATEWVFTGSNSVASGDTLAIAGTVTIDGTIADAGAISVASGGALLFGSGNDVLDLTGNAILDAQGAVDGGGGTNTLELSGTGGTLTGFASNFKHFQVLSVDAGASWTLGGTNTVTAGETLVDDGTLGVSGTFTDDGAITIGAGGALQLSGAADVFDLAAGATLTGSVAGAGGTLELGAGSGAITNLSSFSGFGELAIGTGAAWAVAGTIGAGTLIANQGALIANGALTLDGAVTNTGGTIDAAGGTIDLNGVDITGGTLTSSGGGYNYARGGQVTLTSVAIGGTLQLAGLDTLTLAGDASNAGTIDLGTTPTRGGTDTDITGSFTNTGTITGGSNNDFIIVTGTLENQGVITDNFITIGAAGSLVNAAGATIAGGITASGGPGMLVNAGLLTTPYVTGLYFQAGGYIDNQQGGQIDGQLAIDIQGAAGTVVNAGTIGAIYLDSGTVDNATGGVLSGYVHIGGGAGTLINAGTISGAVSADLVRFDAGAVFGGTVSGETLELSAGGGIGTLSGFGTNFTGFQSVLVDAGAAWSLVGNNTLTTGESLLDQGALTVNGTLLVDGAATVSAGGTLSVNGTLTDSGTISIASGGALDFGAGNDVFDLTGGAVLNASGVVDGGAGTNTLELSGTGGTLSGFGTNFTDFQVLSVDAGAAWSLAGNNTLTASESLLDQGSLGLNGTLAVYGAATVDAGGTLSVSGALIDAGTISIAAGAALDFGAGNDVFDLTGNAVLNAGGAVDGGGGTNTLELSGIGGTLSGFGTNFVDFQVLSVAAGAAWSLAGNNTLSASEQLIAAGGLTINGALVDDGGITLESGGTLTVNGTLTDSGTISIASGGALDFGAGNDVFDLTGGAVLDASGAVDGGGGTNTLELSGTGGTLSGFGTNFTDFQLISLDAGASWTLAGSNTLTAGEQLIDNGTLVITGTLANAGTVADGVTLAAGASLANTGLVETSAANGAGVTLRAGTLSNAGTITDSGLNGAAILATAAASITNTAGGIIDESSTGLSGDLEAGVDLTAGGTLLNFGLIEAPGSIVDGVILAGGAGLYNAGTITVGAGSGVVIDAGSSATNAAHGQIIATGALGRGVNLYGGTLTNDGAIAGAGVGVFLRDSASVSNDGTISGTGGVGVGIYLYAGGSVSNAGLIEGIADAAYLRGGSLTNTGTLLATGAGGIGLDLVGNATAIDQGLIEGATGVEVLGASATLDVSGTIIGTGGTAIVLGGAGDLLKWEAGAVIDGAIAGGGGTLDLAAGTAAIGTLAGLGGTITDFTLIEIGQKALWNLAGQNTLSAGETLDAAGALLVSGTLIDAGSIAIGGSLDLTGTIDITNGALEVTGALTGSGLIDLSDFGSLDLRAAASGGTIDFTDGTGLLTIANAGRFADQITGFGHGDTIDLTGIAFSSADTVTYAGGHAIVYDNGSIVADFLLSGLPPGAELSLQSDQHGGTDLIDPTGPACFLAGTSLATAAGETRVEDLVPGMLAATIAGNLAPVRWIGRRRYDPAALEIGRDKVLPIIIRAGALGENLPRRDLMVSPEHCLYVGAALIPARMLVNGTSIVQRRSLEPIDYIHVELDEHAILLAEGAAAESYREIGNNRAEFAITAGTAVPPNDACAPILTAGPELRAIREALERQVPTVCREDEVAA